MFRIRRGYRRRLPNGQVPHRSGVQIETVFFVHQRFVSLVTDSGSGEAGLIGRESNTASR